MAEATRELKVYVVRNKESAPRLVRAKSRHQALAHVVKDDMTVDLASQETLIECVGAGIVVELASDAAEGQQPLPI